jgi:hypothetical protein
MSCPKEKSNSLRSARGASTDREAVAVVLRERRCGAVKDDTASAGLGENADVIMSGRRTPGRSDFAGKRLVRGEVASR